MLTTLAVSAKLKGAKSDGGPLLTEARMTGGRLKGGLNSKVISPKKPVLD